MLQRKMDGSLCYLKSVIKFYTFLIFSLVCLNACSYLNEKAGLPDDNIIEESVEAVIKENMGVDIDLTPSSKE